MKDGVSRKFEHSLEGLASSNDMCVMSKCQKLASFLNLAQ